MSMTLEMANTCRDDDAVVLETMRDGLQVSGARRLTRLFLAVSTQVRYGALIVQLPDGRRYRMQGPEQGPVGEMLLRNEQAPRRLLLGGGVGFAESYIEGAFDTPDLMSLLYFAGRNEAVFDDEMLRGKLAQRLLNRVFHLLRSNSRSGSRRNISHHYDLGNAFYGKWLDASMTYSSAVYGNGANSLETAQHQKYARLAEAANIQADHHVLEIGSGWGGFAEFAAKHIGCRVTGLTISREQHAYMQQRMFENGLADRVEIRLQDYRDVRGSFDRIASIEMLEAVGEKYWPTFFAKVRDSLTPGGVAGIQVITMADKYFDAYRSKADFIQRYIFPGGCLLSPKNLRKQAQAAGLRWCGDRDYGGDYARTLADWRKRFLSAWPQIEPLGFDQRFQRMWEYYLAYCEAGFRADFTDVKQLALARD